MDTHLTRAKSFEMRGAILSMQIVALKEIKRRYVCMARHGSMPIACAKKGRRGCNGERASGFPLPRGVVLPHTSCRTHEADQKLRLTLYGTVQATIHEPVRTYQIQVTTTGLSACSFGRPSNDICWCFDFNQACLTRQRHGWVKGPTTFVGGGNVDCLSSGRKSSIQHKMNVQP